LVVAFARREGESSAIGSRETAALMLADLVSPGIAVPLIAIGIALSIVAQSRGRQHIPSH
jgi:hypothetical protein